MESTATTPNSETAAIELTLQSIEKGLRAFKLYLPNNPIFQRAADNVRDAFRKLWEDREQLSLTVAECDFVWEDEVVWTQDAKSHSISWMLYQDGIRSLVFQQGVEHSEIIKFLQVLRTASELPADSPDDLLTLLWEQQFEFLTYTFIDVSQEGDSFEAPDAQERTVSDDAVRHHVREEVEEEKDEPSGFVNMDDFDSTLYFLEEEEIEYLKSEIDREYRQNLNANVLSMLFDLLELQKAPEVRDEILENLENLLPHLLSAGDFASVTSILNELRIVQVRAPELSDEHRQRMGHIPHRLSEPEAIAQLLQALDQAVVHPSEEDLGQLFSALQPSALSHILPWLPKLKTERVRELLKVASARLARAHSDAVSKALEHDDADFLIQLLDVVGRAAQPKFVPPLQRLMGHHDPEVRKAAGNTLASIGSPGALKALEGAVEDPDRDVRIIAVQHLAAKRHVGVFAKIQTAVQGRALRGADLSEKKAFFEAYGLLAGDKGIGALRSMLHGKGLFKRKADPEVRACAAMALGKIGTRQARDVLNAVGGEKDPLVKNAVGRALREIV